MKAGTQKWRIATYPHCSQNSWWYYGYMTMICMYAVECVILNMVDNSSGLCWNVPHFVIFGLKNAKLAKLKISNPILKKLVSNSELVCLKTNFTYSSQNIPFLFPSTIGLDYFEYQLRLGTSISTHLPFDTFDTIYNN